MGTTENRRRISGHRVHDTKEGKRKSVLGERRYRAGQRDKGIIKPYIKTRKNVLNFVLFFFFFCLHTLVL